MCAVHARECVSLVAEETAAGDGLRESAEAHTPSDSEQRVNNNRDFVYLPRFKGRALPCI